MRDPLNRAAGRVQVAPADQPAIPGGAKAGYQYEPPQHGGSLMRWRIKATFPTGPKNELRWHDGFVFDHRSASSCTSIGRSHTSSTTLCKRTRPCTTEGES